MRSSTNLLIYWSVETVHSYSGGTNRSGEPCYNFSISKDRTQILFFLLRSMAVTLAVLLFWICFFLLTLVFVLQWLLSIGKFWSCSCLSFYRISFRFKGERSFTAELSIILLIGTVHLIIWDIPCVDILKLGATDTAGFCEWVQVWINVYMAHPKYHVKPHLFAWFSAGLLLSWLRNHFLFLPTEQIFCN